MLIKRNSFIQMSKLSNVKGRINYIASKARQENLYAVYETTERKFWSELAKCNQEEFKKSGTDGTCIEARELIIALPESFTEYQPNMLLKLFTEHFKQTYGMECIAALHHNKRKTNYHIHLIFSERKLLDVPEEKVATRNMFYDETGKHRRTKKEILDEEGNLRDGCKIIPNGTVYERTVFTIKDTRFKQESFLDEVKKAYTDLINLYVKNEKERLTVFDKKGPYLPTKKIGKNNPKATQVALDNEQREKWNQTVDRAILCGVPDAKIVEIRKQEIGRKASISIQKDGHNPNLFATIIQMAIMILELLIRQLISRKESVEPKAEISERSIIPVADKVAGIKRLDRPKMSELAHKYPRLEEVYQKLRRQNSAIQRGEEKLQDLEQELTDCKGLFKGKKRGELQVSIDNQTKSIESMKARLSGIVKEYGYPNVKTFMMEYKASKSAYDEYKYSSSEWEKKYGDNPQDNSVRERLKQKQEEIENRQQPKVKRKDRGAR